MLQLLALLLLPPLVQLLLHSSAHHLCGLIGYALLALVLPCRPGCKRRMMESRRTQNSIPGFLMQSSVPSHTDSLAFSYSLASLLICAVILAFSSRFRPSHTVLVFSYSVPTLLRQSSWFLIQILGLLTTVFQASQTDSLAFSYSFPGLSFVQSSWPSHTDSRPSHTGSPAFSFSLSDLLVQSSWPSHTDSWPSCTVFQTF
jgi:hypothetical protein